MSNYRYIVSPSWDGKTLQDFLRTGEGYSLSTVRRLKHMDHGMVLNGRRALVIEQLRAGDIVEVNIEDHPAEVQLSEKLVPVIYEDEDFIVFDKPPRMPVHQSRIHQNDTLANVFAAYFGGRGGALTFRPINRLDRDTSGLCLVAKNPHSAAIAGKTVKKKYLAITVGHPGERGQIDLPIDREEDSIIKRKVSDGGKAAITEYEELLRTSHYSLLRVSLPTGRTHQIRVHMSHMGYPLVGDTLYGQEEEQPISRQALQCSHLRFLSPRTDEIIEISLPLAEDMRNLLIRDGADFTADDIMV